MPKINAFKIDSSKIPRKVNVYRFNFNKELEDDKEMFSFAWRNGGIVRDGKFLTLLRNDEIPEKNNLIYDKNLNFEDMEINTKLELIHTYVSFKLKNEDVIKGLKNRIKQTLIKKVGKDIGRFTWDIQVFDDIVFHKEFYYVLNFRVRVFFKQNIWDYVERNPEKLKNLIGKSFKFEANPKYIYRIESIIYPNQSEFENILTNILTYLDKKYPKYMRNKKIDKNQPILLGCRGYREYPYLPQLCFLSPKMEEFEEGELRKFQKLWGLKNHERFEIIKSAFEGSIKKSEILEIESKIYEKPLILVNQKDNRIFGEGYKPYNVPEVLPKELDTYILIDESLDSSSTRDFVNEFINRFNAIPQVPKLKTLEPIRFSPEKPIDIDEETQNSEPLAFSLILFRIEYPPFTFKGEKPYERIKRLLFNKNIISQALIYSKINEDNKKIILENILIQSMSKLGIQTYTLKSKIPYDYIVGVDVGRHWKGKLGVGGCSVVITGDGVVKRIIPIPQPTVGDTLKISRFLESIHAKDSLSGKKILVLRDGNLRMEELNDLKNFVQDYKIESLTYMNVVKRHKIFMVSEKNGEGVVFDDGSGLLLPHGKDYKQKGPKPIRIKDKYVFDKNKGEFQRVKISHDDLKVLNDLTYLTFSMFPLRRTRTKLPAPVYLADRFVKALGRGWSIRDELLENGLLYFL